VYVCRSADFTTTPLLLQFVKIITILIYIVVYFYILCYNNNMDKKKTYPLHLNNRILIYHD